MAHVVFWFTSRAVTLALGTADPEGSVTVPVIEPAACCARSVAGARSSSASSHAYPDSNNDILTFEFTGSLLKWVGNVRGRSGVLCHAI